MKKMLLPLLSVLLVAGLSYGTYSKSPAPAACPWARPDALQAGAGLAGAANATDYEEGEGIKQAVMDAARQGDAQGVSFPDRVLHLIDTFGKMVMVI